MEQEMHKNQSGCYGITFFDQKGSKIKRESLGDSGLIRAKMRGDSAIEMGEATSFMVYRILYNSIEGE